MLNCKLPNKLAPLAHKYLKGIIKQILHGVYRGSSAINFPSVLAVGLLRVRGNRPHSQYLGENRLHYFPSNHVVFVYYCFNEYLGLMYGNFKMNFVSSFIYNIDR